jgi:hypothetical protein
MALDSANHVTLFMERDGVWHEPVLSSKRTVWEPTGDSVTIALHRHVDLQPYLRRKGGDLYTSHIYKGTTANILWDTDLDARVEEMPDIQTVVFPKSSYAYTDWGFEKSEVGFLTLGGSKTPLFYARMGLTAAHDCETYTHWVNEGLWRRYGDRYFPLNLLELSRVSNRMDSYDRRDLETVHRVEDTDGDGTPELVYRRTYIVADSGKQTEFSDVGEIIFEFTEGDPPPPNSSVIGNVSGFAPGHPNFRPSPKRRRTTLQPARIVTDDRTVVPTRPSLPALLFPGARAFGTPDPIARWDNSTSLAGPPTGGGHFLRLGSDRLLVFKENGSHGKRRPSLSFRLVDDSVEFVATVFQKSTENPGGIACTEPDYSVVLWFDTDLSADFNSSSNSGDDCVYVVEAAPDDAGAAVTRYNFEEQGDSFTLRTGNQHIGSFSRPRQPEYWPHIFKWRLSRQEIGLVEREGFPTMCGYAAEIACKGVLATDGWYHIASEFSHPRGFDRTDPRTWSTLMIANRTDTVYVSKY